MNLQGLCFSILSVALALLVGCGSSPASDSGNIDGSPAVVTFTVTGIPPTAVATKVGTGPFTTATLTSGTVTLSLPSGVISFAVAYTCSTSFPPSGNGPSTEVEEDLYEATTLDGSAFTGSCLGGATIASAPKTGTVTGEVDASAIPGISNLAVMAGSNGYGVDAQLFDDAASFGFDTAAGFDRVLLLAYRSVSSPPALTASKTLVAVKNLENQVVPGAVNGGSPVVLATSDETTPVAVTLGNLPSGYTLNDVVAQLMTPLGGIILAAPATTQYPALPAGVMESGDYYSISADGGAGVNGEGASTHITRTTPIAVPVAFTFPVGWSYAGPSPASMPVFDLSYPGFSGTDGVSYVVSGVWSPAGLGEQHVTIIDATRNYLGGEASISWPDLSSVTGFFGPPASGSSVAWEASVAQTIYATQSASPADSTVTSVMNVGEYTVP